MSTSAPIDQDDNSTDMFVVVGTVSSSPSKPALTVPPEAPRVIPSQTENMSVAILPPPSLPESYKPIVSPNAAGDHSISPVPVTDQNVEAVETLAAKAAQVAAADMTADQTSLLLADHQANVPVNLSANVVPSAAVPTNLSINAPDAMAVPAEYQETLSSSTVQVTSVPGDRMPVVPASTILAESQETAPPTAVQNVAENTLPSTAVPAEGPENLSIVQVSILPSTAAGPAAGQENLGVTVLPNTAMPEAENYAEAENLSTTMLPQEGNSLPAFSVMAGMGEPQGSANGGLAGGVQQMAAAENLSTNGMTDPPVQISVGMGQVLVKGELPSPTAPSADPTPPPIRLLIPEPAANNGVPIPTGQISMGHILVKGEHPSPVDQSCSCDDGQISAAEVEIAANQIAQDLSTSDYNTDAGQVSMGRVMIKGEYPSPEEAQYVTADGQQYITTDGQTYVTTDGHTYVTADGQTYIAADGQEYADQHYATADNTQYAVAGDQQYTSTDETQYTSTDEAQYSTADEVGAAEVQVHVPEKLFQAGIATPTLVQILRDPCTILRRHDPHAAALLVSSMSQMPAPENLSSSATAQLPITDTYSRGYASAQMSVPEDIAGNVVVSSAMSDLPGGAETLPETALPVSANVNLRLPRPVELTQLPRMRSMYADGLSAASKGLRGQTQQALALCLSTKNVDSNNPQLAVVKREVEYPDYSENYSASYSYQSAKGKVHQFSPTGKPRGSAEQTIRLPSIDTVVDRRMRMETPSREKVVVERRMPLEARDTSGGQPNTSTSSGLSEDVLSEFAIEFLAQRALQQSAQQAALQQAARQAAEEAARVASTETLLQVQATTASSISASASLAQLSLAMPLPAAPLEPAKKRRRSQPAAHLDNEPLNLGSKKRQRTAMSMDVAPSSVPSSPAPGPRKQRSYTHTGGRTCVCEVCNAVLSAPASLKTHMLIHTNIKPYPCNHCEAAFRHQSTLKRHMCIHTGEKKFSCSICGAQFARKTELTQHQRSHSTARPYSCKICGSSYKHPKDLSQHLRAHAKNAPHVCKDCNTSFNDIGALKDHSRIHEGAGHLPTCDVCQMKFETVLELTQHVVSSHMPSTPVRRESQDGKPSTSTSSPPQIKCLHCSRHFDHTDAVATHMKETHWEEHLKTLTETKKGEGGVQQLHCKICSRRFSTTTSLAQHIKKKHWFSGPPEVSKAPAPAPAPSSSSSNQPPKIERQESSSEAGGDDEGLGEGDEEEDIHKYGCSLCGMEYPRLKSLAQHMKKSHSVNMLPCNKCGSTFVHMHNWLDHLKTCE